MSYAQQIHRNVRAALLADAEIPEFMIEEHYDEIMNNSLRDYIYRHLDRNSRHKEDMLSIVRMLAGQEERFTWNSFFIGTPTPSHIFQDRILDSSVNKLVQLAKSQLSTISFHKDFEKEALFSEEDRLFFLCTLDEMYVRVYEIAIKSLWDSNEVGYFK